MKFWLWVFVFTTDGTTKFDVEYTDLPACLVAMKQTEKELLARKTPGFILACQEYPIPKDTSLREPKNKPEIKT